MNGGIFRLCGAACLVFCGWCVGDGICAREQEHEQALQKTLELVGYIRREIGFRRTDLRVLLDSLQRDGMVGQAVDSVQAIPPFHSLNGKEKRVFQECLTGLGHLEAEQECQRLALYQERFETFQQDLLPELKTTKDLSHKLGVSLGLAAAILLL